MENNENKPSQSHVILNRQSLSDAVWVLMNAFRDNIPLDRNMLKEIEESTGISIEMPKFGDFTFEQVLEPRNQ